MDQSTTNRESGKHTPGPWRIGKTGGTVVCDTATHREDASGVEYYGGHLVAESICRREDALLIAAAPDLLAACESIVDFFGTLGTTRQMLLAAIYKARGVQVRPALPAPAAEVPQQ